MKTKKQYMKKITTTVMVFILSNTVYAIIHPLTEEAAEAYFREKAAENYARIISGKIEELKKINNIITENPSTYNPDIQKTMKFFITILQPVYVTIILVSGIYLMFYSGSPIGRSKAKNALTVALIGLAVITVSPHILSIFFGISKSLTLIILAQSPVETEGSFVHASEYMLEKAGYVMAHTGPSKNTAGVERAGVMFFLIPYFILETIFFMLKLRYYIITVLAVFFPLTITLYALIPTRGLGKLLTEQTILWTFSQTAMALSLMVVAVGVNLTSSITSFEVSSGLKFIMEFAGLLMLALSPIAFVVLFHNFLKEP